MSRPLRVLNATTHTDTHTHHHSLFEEHYTLFLQFAWMEISRFDICQYMKRAYLWEWRVKNDTFSSTARLDRPRNNRSTNCRFSELVTARSWNALCGYYHCYDTRLSFLLIFIYTPLYPYDTSVRRPSLRVRDFSLLGFIYIMLSSRK